MTASARSQAANSLLSVAPHLAESTVKRQYALQNKLWDETDAPRREKSVRDVGYHLSYLSEALTADEPALFTTYTEWVASLFASLGFPESVLPTTLTCLQNAVDETLPDDEASAVREILQISLAHLNESQPTPPSFLPEEGPLADLAASYSQLLLAGKRHEASKLIMDAATQGVPVKEIYLQVFQSSQHEIGRLWQTNQISVAQEHYCTAATQMIMSQLYPFIFQSERNGRRLVATSVGGELHELGVRMVTDFFEMAGWDTYYLGANTPADSVVSAIKQYNPDILAISATITPHVSEVAELIQAVRQEVGSSVKIMVGGYPFNIAPDLWQKIDADGYGADAQQAILTAEGLVA